MLVYVCVTDLPPLVCLLVAVVSQHQRLGAQQDQFELVLDLPAALGLVDELTAAQAQLQLRQQVLSTFITLTNTEGSGNRDFTRGDGSLSGICLKPDSVQVLLHFTPD